MKKGMKIQEAFFWVLFAGVAAHLALWLLNQTASAFY